MNANAIQSLFVIKNIHFFYDGSALKLLARHDCHESEPEIVTFVQL